MNDNLIPALRLVLVAEGGFADHPGDSGGPTMAGITLATLSAWRRETVTVDDLKAMAADERAAIYKSQYADKVSFGRLPLGLDYAVLDYAVNSGPAQAVKSLQACVGVATDGIIGAKTLSAVESMPPDALVRALCARRLAYLKTLAKWTVFGNGWAKRVRQVESAALGMWHDYGVGFDHEAIASAKGTGAVKVTATPSGQTAIVTAASVALACGTAASAATDHLTPFADNPYVHYALFGCAVVSSGAAIVSSVASLLVAADRAKAGSVT